MRKITAAFIMLLVLALLFTACNKQEEVEETEILEYDIVIEDTVDVYIWEDILQIEPRLMDNHGRVVPSRFDYQTDSSDIEISYDGVITISNVPTEPVSVTIFEKNTSTVKTIELNFVSDFNNVKAITKLDGSRVESLDGLVLTEDIVLSVVTDQRNMKIKDFVTIKVTDKSGNEKKVFEISFDKSNITFKPVGIGEGEIFIEIVNGAGNKLYTSTVTFNVEMKDSALSAAILTRENKELLSAEELDAVDDIVIDSSVRSLAETKYITALDTVIIKGNEMLVFESAPTSCFYRVKDSLYENYYANPAYGEVKDSIIPYKNSYDERYAIYHSTKGEALSFGLIDSGMIFPTNTSKGYTNTGWEDSDGGVTEAKVNGMKNEVVHLFAVWEANENQLVFDGNGCTGGQMNNQIIRSDASANLVKNGFQKAGYSFKGWSTSAGGGVVFDDGSVYNMGLDDSYTLYAVWEANINKVRFNANGGDGIMSDLLIATDAQSALMKNQFNRKGYLFAGWTNEKNGAVVYTDESVYAMGTEPVYELYAVWAPIEYKITYKLEEGTLGYAAPVKYTIEDITLKLIAPVRPNYTFLGWIGEGIEEPETDVVIKPTADTLKDLEYTAVWGAKVMLLPNGANAESVEQIIRLNTETEKLKENTFKRAGHVFLGWAKAPDGDVVYKDTAEFKCGSDGVYYLYAVWHEGTPGLSYSGSSAYTVNGYKGDYTDIIIPSKYKGVTITGISSTAIKGNTKITSLDMPVDVTNYSAGFLAGCSGLTSVRFNPVGVTTFGACFGTSSYKGSVAVKQTVKDSQKTYYLPENLRSVTLMGTQVSEGFFENCKNIASVVLEYGVTKIGEKAFMNCTNLRSVIIPEGVTEIGDYAFAGCTQLETIILPQSLEYIGRSAFDGCTSLGNVVLRSKKVSVSDYAFAECKKLSFVFISESMEHIGKYAFKNCVKLDTFIFPAITATVDEHAFDGCTGLVSVTVKGNTTQFAENAFSGCTGLKSVTITDNVTDFDPSAFTSLKNNVFTVYDGAMYVGSVGDPYKILIGAVNKSIEKCTIANGTKIIEEGAFAGCGNLKEITIPASVYVIKERAFENCKALKAVHITSIDAWCRIQYLDQGDKPGTAIMNPLYYAHSLYLNGNAVTHVNIPEGLVRINRYTFQGCTTLESVTIPGTVESIGEAAFMGCSSLREIVIPNKITVIGEYAFAECDSLKVAVFEGTSLWCVLKDGSSLIVKWNSIEEAAKRLSKEYASCKWYK